MQRNEQPLVNDFHQVRIALAGPADILSWSSGEVKRADTINYRTHRPERDGLFCERIFGPERDWECACGKFRGYRFKNLRCERCGVEVVASRVRRKRMGHIELACPVVHIWFFRNRPSLLATLLDIRPGDLEAVIYQKTYVLLDPGPTGLQRGRLLSDEEVQRLIGQHGRDFRVGTGAEAVEDLLTGMDLDALVSTVRAALRQEKDRPRPSQEKVAKLIRRLELLQELKGSGNRPEWMVLRRIPVIPPDLRPMVLLESGQYATSDLNDLYRRVIQRNIRLRKLLELNAPEVILRNEKRLMQQAVDCLFDNARTHRPVVGPGNRPLRSLADMLAGKEGRFRLNLLGKRVDYSGRSVIVVGPELGLHQCGLPKVMALELFQPFIIRRLLENDSSLTTHRARRMIKNRHRAVWDALEVVMKDHPVLLNRAPTLHRMSIQAFYPVLIEGNAIRLHPLVCKAFNADFDGDQMAVHVPLSKEAIAEARLMLLATDNIFSPASGQPIITPSKDLVLGCYYLTATEPVAEGRSFTGIKEVLHAQAEGKIGIHDTVVLRLATTREIVGLMPDRVGSTGQRVRTTVGRVMFADVLGRIDLEGKMPFYNLPLSAKNLSRIVADCRQRLGQSATVRLLERIKEVGFHEATRSGISFSADDLCHSEDRLALQAEAQRQADEFVRLYEEGLLSEEERHEQVIHLWEETTHKVSERLMQQLATDRRPEQVINPIHAMVASGARGSTSQIGQLAGMRGPMRRPTGEVLETPIKASFREGLSSLEYFSSTTGARKGLVDMAMKTSDSGYLTRKLVDAAQHVVVTESDCGTLEGVRRTPVMQGEQVLRSLGEVVLGRVGTQRVVHPVTKVVIVEASEMITHAVAGQLDSIPLPGLIIRSPMTCKAKHGVCRKCYGMDRSTGRLVETGTAVGVIAAQSIGEPATQLIMRTFHTGGAATSADITLSLPRVVSLFEAHKGTRQAVLAEVTGRVQRGGGTPRKRGQPVLWIQPLDAQGQPTGPARMHVVPWSRRILVADGERVERGQTLTNGVPNPHDLLRLRGAEVVRMYLLEEVQKVYRSQGVELDDKHIEVVISRMLAKVRVIDGGDTILLPGQIVDRHDLAAHQAKLQEAATRPVVESILLGVSKAALFSTSFLSAASFQHTPRVLTRAALAGQRDDLTGLKENVLLGRRIPAGTGFRGE